MPSEHASDRDTLGGGGVGGWGVGLGGGVGGLRGFYLNLDPEISGEYSIKETPLDFKLIDHH